MPAVSMTRSPPSRTCPFWVRGHTHIARTYRVGNTVVRSNAIGLAAKGGVAPGFSVKAYFEIG